MALSGGGYLDEDSTAELGGTWELCYVFWLDTLD